jgi:hypothetical protein
MSAKNQEQSTSIIGKKKNCVIEQEIKCEELKIQKNNRWVMRSHRR